MAKKKAETKASGGEIKLQPLADRLVIEREESEEVTAGGIVLPDTAKDKPARPGGQRRRRADAQGREAHPLPSQGRRPRAVLFVRRRGIQGRRQGVVVDAGRGCFGGDRVRTSAGGPARGAARRGRRVQQREN